MKKSNRIIISKTRLNGCYTCLSELWDDATLKQRKSIITIKEMINEINGK